MNNKTESKETEVVPEVKKKSNKVEIIKGIISYLLFNNLVLVIAILAVLMIPTLNLEDAKIIPISRNFSENSC